MKIDRSFTPGVGGMCEATQLGWLGGHAADPSKLEPKMHLFWHSSSAPFFADPKSAKSTQMGSKREPRWRPKSVKIKQKWHLGRS